MNKEQDASSLTNDQILAMAYEIFETAPAQENRYLRQLLTLLVSKAGGKIVVTKEEFYSCTLNLGICAEEDESTIILSNSPCNHNPQAV